MGDLVGIPIIIVAGVLGGLYTLPMKFIKNWAWENTYVTPSSHG